MNTHRAASTRPPTRDWPFASWLLLIGLLALCQPSFATEEMRLAALPDSLGQWYKPQNKRQVWLHTMFSLRRELQAIEEYTDMQEADRVRKWSDRFVKHLRSIPEMVPEWQDAVEWGEVDRLEQAVSAGDLATVPGSLDRIQRDCRSCHREYRVLAALRYRSPDFTTVTVDDGRGGRVEFANHMETLSLTLNRIKIASEDDRWSQAAKAAAALRAELTRMASTCDTCHQDQAPKERILGEASQALLDGLDTALAHRQLRETGLKLGEAAVTVCARCHATHRTLSEMKQLLFD